MKKVRFSDIFDDVTKMATKIPTDQYLSNGTYQIIDQGKSEIAGYTNKEDGLFIDVPAIIFGDHTRVFKYIDKPLFLGADGVKLLKARNISLNPKYLYYALCNVHIPDTGYNRHFKWLKEVEITIPSIDEQQKIASVLDKVSDLIALRKQQLAKLDELVKSRFVEMFGEPEFNTKSWPIQPLGELCSVGSSKRIYQNELCQKGIPFWRISDLVSKMDTGVAESGLFIPEEKYLELKREGLVPITGDILITSRGTLGRCYIISNKDRFYFQDGMISWLSSYAESITPLYLQYLFMMSGFRKQIDSMQAGSTVAYLSIAMLKKLMIMMPNKDEQKCFANFVAQNNKSKLEIKKSLDELNLLKKSLMQEYFG
jgi:type I restriction enzyme S subunit